MPSDSSHMNQSVSLNAALRSCARITISGVFAVVLAFNVSVATAQQETPLWQQGISTWNGTGYDLPAAPPAPAVPTAQVSPASFVPSGATEADPQTTVTPASVAETTGTVAQASATGPVGSAVESGLPVEQPPLQEEVVQWYSYPMRWISDGWDNHAEFGIDGSDGNSDTLALQTGLELKRKTDLYTLAFDFDYRQASTSGVTSENNGRFNTDFDRLIGDSSWTMFTKLGLEWDKFKAFDLRVNINGGAGYYWVKDDDSTLITRIGAGASREMGAVDDDWIPEGVFGVEAEHQLTQRQKLKGKIDYFPAWENFNDFRLVSDFAWEILLDGAENLSLKLALTDRYDSTPQGAKPNDVYYSFLLLYKF